MSSEKQIRPTFGNDIKEILSAAGYIEQLMATEQQWIMNRLAWFLTSQSFLIAASVLLFVNKSKISCTYQIGLYFLVYGIPMLGLISCFLVRKSIKAGEVVLSALAFKRVLLTDLINDRLNIDIPRIGPTENTRSSELKHTLRDGALPHQLLPNVFGIYWILFLASNLL